MAKVKMLKGFPLEIKLMLGLIIFEFCVFFFLISAGGFLWFLVLVCGMPLSILCFNGVFRTSSCGALESMTEERKFMRLFPWVAG